MGSYWEDRFQTEGKVWGETPSVITTKAISSFRQRGVKQVLVLGAGYGRNTKELAKYFKVDGIEVSGAAVKLAREWDTHSNVIHASVLDVKLPQKYDAVFCYNLLHLFKRQERNVIIGKCSEFLRKGGSGFFTLFSDEDSNCGKGSLLEPNTYEYKQGKFAHFFNELDLSHHFANYTILDTGSFREQLHYAHEQSTWIDLRYVSFLKD
ncbi:class I SAM-dependent methyltransferase [Paenibacillus sp. FSL R7-0652]|uniref:class I SAM-dependent methyltransferase n=1 Tax=Paenibacillus sp. FSL R7-0652 TaxID=2921687 RepID=UPI00315AF7A0